MNSTRHSYPEHANTTGKVLNIPKVNKLKVMVFTATVTHMSVAFSIPAIGVKFTSPMQMHTIAKLATEFPDFS